MLFRYRTGRQRQRRPISPVISVPRSPSRYDGLPSTLITGERGCPCKAFCRKRFAAAASRLTDRRKSIAGNPNVRLVHPPWSKSPAQLRTAAAVQLGCVAPHPAPDGDVIGAETSLGHHFFQIAEAEPKPEIPADTEDKNLRFEVSSFGQCRPVSYHPSQRIRRPLRICSTSL